MSSDKRVVNLIICVEREEEGSRELRRERHSLRVAATCRPCCRHQGQARRRGRQR